MSGSPGDWAFACPDWAARLRAGRSLVPALPLDENRAAAAVAIFDRLRIPDAPGQPALRDIAAPWQHDLVRALLGSLDGQGRRHVPEALVLIPKKNAKTTTGSALLLTTMLAEPERNQEYHLYGPTQQIAERAFAQAWGMIKADPEGFLQQRFHVQEHRNTIIDLATDSRLKVKTFSMEVATGTAPRCALVDELHLMGAMHFASRVIGQIRGGMISRPGSWLAFITTQSDLPPAGVFREELQLARAIRDGRVTGESAQLLPMLYEFPEAVQTDPARPWEDPALWPMVTPSLGRSIALRDMIAAHAAEKEKGEETERLWASQHLNVEIGLALHSNRWRGADYWTEAGDPTLTLDTLIARCEVCVIGIDGGGLDDLYGLCVAGRERGTGRWLFWHHAWAWPEVLLKRKDISPRLRDFAAQGDLTLCTETDRAPAMVPMADGVEAGGELAAPPDPLFAPAQDVAEIVAIVEKVRDAGLLPEQSAIGVDPAGIASLVDALDLRGISYPMLVGIGQGYRLNPAVMTLPRMLKDGSALHDARPLMAWCVGNAKAMLHGSATVITKQVSGSGKIDPLIAMFNAFMLLAKGPVAPEPDRPSVYESRGLMVLG